MLSELIIWLSGFEVAILENERDGALGQGDVFIPIRLLLLKEKEGPN